MGKGPRKRKPSKGSYHKKTVRSARKHASLPPASDVEVRDAEGNLLRVERSKKPLT